MKKEGTTKRIWIFSISIAIIITSLIILYTSLKGEEIQEIKGINLTAEELPGYLGNHQIVKDLPEDTSIKVSFGNKDYIISGNEIKEIGENASQDLDLEIKIPETYIEKIGQNGLCSTAKEMSKDPNLEIKINIEEKDLLWKYKGLLKYKNCFED